MTPPAPNHPSLSGPGGTSPRDILAALDGRLTNRQIADALGVHEVTVSRWRTGAREVTDWRHVDALRLLAAEFSPPAPASAPETADPGGGD